MAHEDMPTWRLREQLRRAAEETIRGRQAFEEHHLDGRKSTKPLTPLTVSPLYMVQLLDEMDRLERIAEAAGERNEE